MAPPRYGSRKGSPYLAASLRSPATGPTIPALKKSTGPNASGPGGRPLMRPPLDRRYDAPGAGRPPPSANAEPVRPGHVERELELFVHGVEDGVHHANRRVPVGGRDGLLGDGGPLIRARRPHGVGDVVPISQVVEPDPLFSLDRERQLLHVL